jgi:hypothetical protein
MAEINDLTATDASNTARFPEGMRVNAVNDSARALEGLIARWYKDTNGSVAVAGTDTFTATINADTGFSLYDGFVFMGDFANANTGAATINLTPDGGSALGAKAIKKGGSAALASGDIPAGGKILMVYDGTNFQMLSQIGNDASGDLTTHMADTTTHGVTGAIVGLSDTQTLTNKTLTAPTISGAVGGTATSQTITSLTTTNIELGAATDTTLSRASAGDVNIEGNIAYRAGGTDVPVTDGGTGSSTASAARTALGLAIGTNIQSYSADLAAIAGLTSAADKVPYFTGSGAAAVADFTSAGRALVDDANAAAQLTTLGAVAKAGSTMTGDLILAGNPDAALKAATKQYVDNLLAGLAKRSTVRAATTANITIATALNNGDTLDGVTLATDDLVLVMDQSTSNQNGVYKVASSPARDDLFDTYDEHPGALIVIEEGTVNADTIYLCTSNTGGTLDSTAINWTKIQPQTGGTVTSIAAGYGLTGGTITSSGSITTDKGSSDGTGATLLPVGTTAQRPTAVQGYFRYNTTTSAFEGYNGSAWGTIGAGVGGFLGEDGAVGNSSDIIRVNQNTLDRSVSIVSTDNGSATGPLSIASGVTLTISSGATFVVI